MGHGWSWRFLLQDDIKALSDKVGEAKTKGAEKQDKPEATAGEEGGPEAPKDWKLHDVPDLYDKMV